MTDTLALIRALATEWANQPTDYDEDTEQQIEDGRAVLAILDGAPPPLGYVVLSRNPDSGRLQPQGRVHAEAGLAQAWQRHLESAAGPRIPIRPGIHFLVAEVRAVQP